MNKNIKLLIEGLFDDDILNDIDSKSDVSKNLIRDDIKKLLNLRDNATIYPDNFTDIDRGYELAQLGLTITNCIFRDKPSVSQSSLKYCYSCEFKSDDNDLQYDKVKISVYNENNPLSKLDLFECCLIGNHIYYLQYLEPFRLYISLSSNYITLSLLDLIPDILNVYAKDSYIIDEVRIAPYASGNMLPDKVKEIHINGFAKRTALTLDEVKEFTKVKITVPNDDGSLFIPLHEAFKNASINFEYCIALADLETMYTLLKYFKDLGFKKMKMDSLIGIFNSEIEYDGVYSSPDLFLKFCEDNKIDLYSFTDKKDIMYIITDNTQLLCKEKYNYDGHSSFMYYHYFGKKGKDPEGSFMEVIIEPEFRNSETDKHMYGRMIWNFYKTGKCELVRDDTKSY